MAFTSNRAHSRPTARTAHSHPAHPLSTAFTLPPPIYRTNSSAHTVHRRPRSPSLITLRRSAFSPTTNIPFRPTPKPTTPHPQQPRATRDADPPPPAEDPDQEFGEMNEWVLALESLFLEALKTYYQGTPMFSDSEFETLREELDHLGSTQLRLGAMEKIWVQATSARDFDRRVREEFEMSEDDLNRLKTRLLKTGGVKRPTAIIDEHPRRKLALPEGTKFLKDATKIEAGERVDERLKWLLFSDASEERFKILLLYFPAVLMSFVTASVFTILFALLDGEMKITVTAAGRFRLGILSYVVVMLTVWFSNQVTPVMLDYLDLGQPTLMRGECPICGAPVSCLFTGAARTRDERKCGICGTMVGFNRKWSKVYMVSPPGGRKFQEPD